MKVEHPNASELSPNEIKELEQLKNIIELAIADGVLSNSEYENIKHAALENRPSAELLYQELQLYRQLISEKVKQGLLVVDHFA